MTIAAALLALLIVALSANAYRRHRGGRPMTEHAVDALYRRAMRATATAVAADRALVAYRLEVAQIQDSHTPLYAEAPCSH